MRACAGTCRRAKNEIDVDEPETFAAAGRDAVSCSTIAEVRCSGRHGLAHARKATLTASGRNARGFSYRRADMDRIASLIAVGGFGLHLVVGVMAFRRGPPPTLLVWLNLASGLGVLAYWVQRWYSYVVNGITWYATDQLLPLYALLVCLFSILTLAERVSGHRLHWLVFGLHAIVLLVAALFLLFVRFDRLF